MANAMSKIHFPVPATHTNYKEGARVVYCGEGNPMNVADDISYEIERATYNGNMKSVICLMCSVEYAMQLTIKV